MLCRGSVRVPRGGDRGSPIAFRDKGSLGGKGVKSVARDDVGSGPANGCRGEGEREVGDLTLIEAGCREPLRGDQALFPRGMMSGGEMDLAWGNKPVEVPDPEDSSTMGSNPAFSLPPILLRRYISMPRTASSLFSILTKFLAEIRILLRETGLGKIQGLG
jgi:hypothetical protein